MIQALASVTIFLWCTAAVVLFFYGWLNYPVLSTFMCLRFMQVNATFDRRPDSWLKFQDGLHMFCAVLYGILLPAFYFISVRLRSELAAWRLGPVTNQRWTIALGVICMIWLTGHVLRTADKNGLRFSGTTDRVMGGLALGLCLWFHACTLNENWFYVHAFVRQWFTKSAFVEFIFGFAYPQSFFLGATTVYGFAFYEAYRNPAEAVPARRGLERWAPSLAAMAIVFAPWWLSLPRVTHAEAMRMLETNRSSIIEVAQGARIDPRLLAGVIYVAQTRDHPRWTGDFIERFGVHLNAQRFGPKGGAPVFDSSVGLCQMRPSTFRQITEALDPQVVPKLQLASREKISLFEYRAKEFSTAIKYPGGRMRGYDDIENTGALLNPEISLNFAGLMLHLLNDQWRQAGFPIDDRPEILATLYNLGFERSKPHGAPKPNDFGRRVKAFMDSDECKKLFEKAAAE